MPRRFKTSDGFTLALENGKWTDGDLSFDDVDGRPVDSVTDHPIAGELVMLCDCGTEMEFSRHCGAWVCEECGNHDGMARCFCGWAASGGDGYNELLEMGETIEPEDY